MTISFSGGVNSPPSGHSVVFTKNKELSIELSIGSGQWCMSGIDRPWMRRFCVECDFSRVCDNVQIEGNRTACPPSTIPVVGVQSLWDSSPKYLDIYLNTGEPVLYNCQWASWWQFAECEVCGVWCTLWRYQMLWSFQELSYWWYNHFHAHLSHTLTITLLRENEHVQSSVTPLKISLWSR